MQATVRSGGQVVRLEVGKVRHKEYFEVWDGDEWRASYDYPELINAPLTSVNVERIDVTFGKGMKFNGKRYMTLFVLSGNLRHEYIRSVLPGAEILSNTEFTTHVQLFY